MNEKIKLPKIYINAEFQRLWWTNVNYSLMLGVVLTYGLFLWFKNENSSWSEYFIVVGTSGIIISAFTAFVMLERSINQDVSSNAFDQLRMSSLSPWQILYSRIIVAPILAWLGFWLGWTLLLINATLTDSADHIILVINLPLIAWAFSCGILINKLQFKRGSSQWSGSPEQCILALIIISNILSNQVGMSYFRPLLLNFSKEFDPIFTFTSSSILLVIFATVAAHAVMSQRLHLKSGHLVFLILSLLSPTLLWWMMDISNIIICYAIATTLSILTQDNLSLVSGIAELKQGRFRLPAWVILFPLGALLSCFINIRILSHYVLQIGGLLTLVLICSRVKLRYQSITVAEVIYLLSYLLFLLLK